MGENLAFVPGFCRADGARRCRPSATPFSFHARGLGCPYSDSGWGGRFRTWGSLSGYPDATGPVKTSGWTAHVGIRSRARDARKRFRAHRPDFHAP